MSRRKIIILTESLARVLPPPSTLDVDVVRSDLVDATRRCISTLVPRQLQRSTHYYSISESSGYLGGVCFIWDAELNGSITPGPFLASVVEIHLFPVLAALSDSTLYPAPLFQNDSKQDDRF